MSGDQQAGDAQPEHQPQPQPQPQPDPTPADVADVADVAGIEPDRDGDLGVSSERLGRTGPAQVNTDGVRDTSTRGQTNDEAAPPEQRPGLDQDDNPVGLKPKAGYPERDPRSD